MAKLNIIVIFPKQKRNMLRVLLPIAYEHSVDENQRWNLNGMIQKGDIGETK